MNAERRTRIFGLALPIVGGMVSQNIMNLVDTGMVGTLGPAPLAAVGLASFATFLSQAFLTGLSTGVQAMASRRKGEGKDDECAVPLNGGLMLALGLGVPLSVLLFVLAPYLFPFLNDDPEVIAAGVPYWQTRIIAVAAVAMNFCFRGFWNGVDLSRLYMRTLIVMHVVNISLNYVLIFGKLGLPALGSTGAAIGTTAATFLGTGTYVLLGFKHARDKGFLRGIPDGKTIRTMLRLSVPMGLQQTFFAGGLTCLFWIVGKVGTEELAAANVIINVTLVGYLPALGLGLAAASLVGQALGRGDIDDARRWGWDVVKLGSAVLFLIGLPMFVVPDLILSAFIQDPHTIGVARIPLRIVGGLLALDGVGLILQNALLGAGYTRRVAAISIGMQWVLFLPAAYVVGPSLGFGLTGIWIAQTVYRVIQAGLFARMWRGSAWAAVEV